jgi:hypothetical protein
VRHFRQLLRNCALASSRLGARPLVVMPSMGFTYTVTQLRLGNARPHTAAPRPGHSRRSHNQATPDKRAMRDWFGVT